MLTGVPSVSCSVIRCTPIGRGSEKLSYGTPNRSLRNKASRSIRVKPNSRESREFRSYVHPKSLPDHHISKSFLLMGKFILARMNFFTQIGTRDRIWLHERIRAVSAD